MEKNETNSGRCIIINIFGFFFSCDWHKTFQYGPSEVKALKLGFFARERQIVGNSRDKDVKSVLLHSPVQSVECKNAKFWIDRTVCTNQEKKVDQLGDMFAKNWDFLNQMDLRNCRKKKKTEMNIRG
jgi:hypothetical protein